MGFSLGFIWISEISANRAKIAQFKYEYSTIKIVEYFTHISKKKKITYSLLKSKIMGRSNRPICGHLGSASRTFAHALRSRALVIRFPAEGDRIFYFLQSPRSGLS